MNIWQALKENGEATMFADFKCLFTAKIMTTAQSIPRGGRPQVVVYLNGNTEPLTNVLIEPRNGVLFL
jgi:hypothetical protein